MHIVYADATLAKSEAEKAAADPNGFLTDATDAAYANNGAVGINYQNSLWNITNAYGDISMGADMESILKGYNDTRISQYFLASASYPGDHKGIRIGIDIPDTRYAGFSLLNVQSSSSMLWMAAAESYFLRAEGALRGWNMGGGTAQSYYEAGVTLSFQEKGASMPAGYLSDNTSVAAAYTDPTNAANNSPGVNNVTIKYDPTATQEVNLQRIITQKWIAMYPDGEEAWTDYRRTGYPKLFTAKINNSSGVISTTLGPRRIPFPSDELQNNPKGVATGITLLGGDDNGGTRLWWDKNPNVK
jgi:hypothetical protein